MNYFILSFNQLNIKQLFEIYKLRSQVFVVEQNCAYQDVDEKDKEGVLTIFKEGHYYEFCPTFKINQGQENMTKDLKIGQVTTNVYSTKRIPAWTDRIIYWTNSLFKNKVLHEF